MVNFFSKRKGDFHVAKEIPFSTYIKPEEVHRPQNLPRDAEVESVFAEIKKVYCALFRYAEMCANTYDNGLSVYGESGNLLWEELQEIDEYIKKSVNTWMSSYGITHDKNGNVQDYDKFTFSPISQAKLGEFETRILPELKKMNIDTEEEWEKIANSEDCSSERYSGCKITPHEALRFFKYVANCSLNGIYPTTKRDQDGYLHTEPAYNIDSLSYQAKNLIKHTLPRNIFPNVTIGNSRQVQQLDFYIACQGSQNDFETTFALCDWEGDPIPETETVFDMEYTDEDIKQAISKIVFYQEDQNKEFIEEIEFENEDKIEIVYEDIGAGDMCWQ